MKLPVIASAWALAFMAAGLPASAEIVIGVPAPLSGPMAWTGEESAVATEIVVAGLNAAGGVLGEQVRVVRVDDHCDAGQAVAAANKLVAEGVDFVVGHLCSAAAIPASRVYADAGIVMISAFATSPLLTEQGFSNIFRVCGRDDLQGAIAGSYLATRWGDKNVAIVHDGSLYGEGLAERTRATLNQHGISEVLFVEVEPDMADPTDEVDRVQAVGADVLYFSGYANDAGLMIRALRDRGDDVQLVSGDALTPAFVQVAGDAADGALFTSMAPAPASEDAAALMAALQAAGYDRDEPLLLMQTAIQAWAQAVEQAGSLEVDAVSNALRGGAFDTVYGRIGFDDKGDVTGYEPFAWFAWQSGEAMQVNLSE